MARATRLPRKRRIENKSMPERLAETRNSLKVHRRMHVPTLRAVNDISKNNTAPSMYCLSGDAMGSFGESILEKKNREAVIVITETAWVFLI